MASDDATRDAILAEMKRLLEESRRLAKKNSEIVRRFKDLESELNKLKKAEK